jgi:hypothetical protein
MAALNESRLDAIDKLCRARSTALDRVVLELVDEVRRLRAEHGVTDQDLPGAPPAA